jgi:hypothetical protein
MSDTPSGSSLVTKLAEVMAAVGRIPKRGTNTHFNYKFATESDVVERIRRELSERSVILCPQILDVKQLDKGLTQIHMSFTFRDGSSGESLTHGWYAQGGDTQDKGISKAATSGEKYFLLKMFLIPTGDDPDAAGPIGERRATRAPDPTPKDDTRLLTAEQVKQLKGLMRTHNTNVEEFKAWVEKRFGYTDSKSIQRRHFAAMTAYIVEGVDITMEKQS